MRKYLIPTLGALASCVALAACTPTGTLDSTATANLQNALAVACPIIGAVQSAGLPLNAAQSAALKTVTLACPPNPPPTSALLAVEDVLSAYAILQPLIKH